MQCAVIFKAICSIYLDYFIAEATKIIENKRKKKLKFNENVRLSRQNMEWKSFETRVAEGQVQVWWSIFLLHFPVGVKTKQSRSPVGACKDVNIFLSRHWASCEQAMVALSQTFMFASRSDVAIVILFMLVLLCFNFAAWIQMDFFFLRWLR